MRRLSKTQSCALHILLLLLGHIAVTEQQRWDEFQTLTVPIENSYREFGSSVAISPSGSFLVVGATTDSPTLSKSGSIYIYTPSGSLWAFKQKLSGAIANAKMGRVVVATDDKIIASSIAESTNTGAIYPYTLVSGTWSSRNKVSGPSTNSYFGTSMTTDGDFLAVGAPYASSEAGRVMIYTVNTNGQWALLTTLSISSSMRLGTSLTHNQNILVSGAPKSNSEKGYVAVWSRSGNGVLNDPAIISSSVANNNIGQAVAIISDSTIAVGCTSGSSFYLFTRDTTWNLSVTISKSNVDKFGSAIAYSAGYLIAGSTSNQYYGYIWNGSALKQFPSTQALLYETSENLGPQIAINNGLLAVPYFSGMCSTYMVGTTIAETCNTQGQGIQFAKLSDNPALLTTAFAPENSKSDKTGYQVAIRNGRAVISVPNCRDTTTSCDGGYLLLYKKNSGGQWSFDQKLNSPLMNRNTKFGLTITTNQDYLIVSAPDSAYINKDVGVIVLYKWSSLSRKTMSGILKDSSIHYRKTNKDYDFGSTISVINSLVAIGMPEHDASSATTESGCVHIYKKIDNGKWGQRVTFVKPTPSQGERLGHSVSLQSETRIAVSNFPTTPSAQAVYIVSLIEDEWKVTQTIQANNKLGFGWKVAFLDNLLYVSSINDGTRAAKAGSIGVYTLNSENQYTFTYDVIPTYGALNTRFGYSFDTDGVRFVVGAKPCLDEQTCNVQGTSYVFTKDSNQRWSQQYQYALGASTGADGYGHSVAIDGDTVIVSAPFDATTDRKGVAYLIKS